MQNKTIFGGLNLKENKNACFYTHGGSYLNIHIKILSKGSISIPLKT